MKSTKGIMETIREAKASYSLTSSNAPSNVKEFLKQIELNTPRTRPEMWVGADFFKSLDDDQFKGMIKSDILFRICMDTLDYINARKKSIGIK